MFYRPPDSLPVFLIQFFTLLSSFDISQYSNFIFVGDFNVDFSIHSHPLLTKISTLMELFSLPQVVNGHTHTSSSGRHSLIDLVFVSNPPTLHSCSVIPPLANSDHLGVHTTFSLHSSMLSKARHCPRKIWRYYRADFSRACQLISDSNWESLLSDDFDESWHQWQYHFLSIMEKCIPRGGLPPRRRNLPWLNKGIIQSMRRRNNFFKKAKISSDSERKYRQVRNNIAKVC